MLKMSLSCDIYIAMVQDLLLKNHVNLKMLLNCLLFCIGSVTCTDVDRHKIVSGSNDRTVKVLNQVWHYLSTAF